MKMILIIGALFVSSCMKYHYTEEGGVRLNNTALFKYNRPRFVHMSKGLIDTNVVYQIDSTFNKWSNPQWEVFNNQFIRFFGNGKVIFANCDEDINNPGIGIPGYYIVKGTKVKIDMFQDLNGGQTGQYFGRIQADRNIVFYEQRPETYFGSFNWLERAEGKKRFSKWKKVKYDNFKNYNPDW
jgi:hypothetical protein